MTALAPIAVAPVSNASASASTAPAPASTAPAAALVQPVASSISSSTAAPVMLPTDGFPKLPFPGPADTGILRLLAPPAPGSTVEQAELAAIRMLQKARTPERDAWANEMARSGGLTPFRALLHDYTDRHGRIRGLGASALMYTAVGATAAATSVFKEHYDRRRPFTVDDRIVAIVKKPKSDSYPSGHSSAAFAAARVIARLDPSMAIDAYRAATEVALSRVYAGVHFPSDVVAGALLGTGVADVVLAASGHARQ